MPDLILELYGLGMIKFGEYRLTSGELSPYYIDLRLAPSYPRVFRRICVRLASMLEPYEYDYILGIATGGIALAAALSMTTGVPMGYFRPARKKHGTGRRLEALVRNRRVAIVDDVATTGSSISQAVEAVREEGGEPVVAAVVVDRMQGAGRRLKSMGVEFVYLFTAEAIFRALYQAGVLGEEKYITLLEYLGKA